MLKKIRPLAIIFLSILLLQACSDIAMTGCQVVYNRRSLQKNFNDHYITREIYQALYMKTDEFKDTHIAIATYNGEVLLAGQVFSDEQKTRVNEIVSHIPGPERVYNLVAVATPTTTLTRVSDAFITGKIKAKFMASNDINGDQIKVVTENGTVYLMGMVTSCDAAAAVDLARNTDGVQSVVRIFSYITISKHPESATA